MLYIDQSGLEDKKRQIPLVGQIYRDSHVGTIVLEHKFSFYQAGRDLVHKVLERARGADDIFRRSHFSRFTCLYTSREKKK